MNWKRIFLIASLATNIYMAYELQKAWVINEVFRRYFRDVRGIDLDLSLIYKDGKQWLEYKINQNEGIRKYFEDRRGCN